MLLYNNTVVFTIVLDTKKEGIVCITNIIFTLHQKNSEYSKVLVYVEKLF